MNILSVSAVLQEAYLPQLLSPFVLLVHFRAIKSHLGVLGKLAIH